MCESKAEGGKRCKSSTPEYRREKRLEKKWHGVSPSHVTDRDLMWSRAGVPVEDRGGWTEFLTKYPRRGLDTLGYGPSESCESMREAEAAVERGDIPDTAGARVDYAWAYDRKRNPALQALRYGDSDEVGAYVQVGGTLAEAHGYRTAFEAWVSREGSHWLHHLYLVEFDDQRYRRLRALKVSPELLHAWVADGGDPRDTDEVGALAKWQRKVCRDAPASHVTLYRAVASTDDEVRAWEKRRKAGEDLMPELRFLRAMTGNAA